MGIGSEAAENQIRAGLQGLLQAGPGPGWAKYLDTKG